MKKSLLFLCAVVIMLCSCTTVKQSATTQQVANQIKSGVYAQLNVSSQKISYTYYPTSKVRRGGITNCVNAAISEALRSNGNADVLVQTEEVVIQHKGFLSKKIKSVTVTGFPAKYTNFESIDLETIKESMKNGK